jgi:hypothetical protein
MQVAEMMVVGRIQLDQLVRGTIHVCVIEAGRVRESADVGDGRLENRAYIELLPIGGRHVFGAPSNVPDGGDNFKRSRARYFVEQQPGFLRPNAILAAVTGFFAIEMMCVEFDGSGGIGRVQVHVMEVRGRLLLGPGHQRRKTADKESIHLDGTIACCAPTLKWI